MNSRNTNNPSLNNTSINNRNMNNMLIRTKSETLKVSPNLLPLFYKIESMEYRQVIEWSVSEEIPTKSIPSKLLSTPRKRVASELTFQLPIQEFLAATFKAIRKFLKKAKPAVVAVLPLEQKHTFMDKLRAFLEHEFAKGYSLKQLLRLYKQELIWFLILLWWLDWVYLRVYIKIVKKLLNKDFGFILRVLTMPLVPAISRLLLQPYLNAGFLESAVRVIEVIILAMASLEIQYFKDYGYGLLSELVAYKSEHKIGFFIAKALDKTHSGRTILDAYDLSCEILGDLCAPEPQWSTNQNTFYFYKCLLAVFLVIFVVIPLYTYLVLLRKLLILLKIVPYFTPK